MSKAGNSFLRATSVFPIWRIEKIAILVDVAAHAFLGREPRQIFFRDRAEALFLPGVVRRHEMPRKRFHQFAGGHVVEAFFLQRGRERTQSGLALEHRHRADLRAEHQPFRRLVLVGVVRPGEAAAADKPGIDANGVRPIDMHRLFRRRVDRERIGERRHAGIEGAPRLPQRLVRFQHHREFDEIETPDKDERAGAVGRGIGLGMGEGIADLAQGHEPVGRRQKDVLRTHA